MDINLKTQGIIDVYLKPREVFFAERGAMSFCDGGIKYSSVDTSFLKSLKRWLGGESFYAVVKFENTSNSIQNLKLRYDVKENACFHHNTTNTEILYFDLKKMNGDLIINLGSFFAATDGVGIDVYFDKNWGRSIFGFGSLFKQRLHGTGTVFILKNRWLKIDELIIESGKTITIDPKEVFGYTKTSLLNENVFSFNNYRVGEGFSSYKFKGPGVILTYKTKFTDMDITNAGVFRFIFLIAIIFIVFKFIFNLIL
jgi:uncharacterized protein (AIM24 family)